MIFCREMTSQNPFLAHSYICFTKKDSHPGHKLKIIG